MEALTASMPNTTAAKLGEIANEAARAKAGDTIDRGLVLVRLLREAGFRVYDGLCPRCGAEMLASEDRGIHCDGCDGDDQFDG
jgi:hypothetical protein